MTSRTLLNLSIILLLGIALLIGQNLWGRYQARQPNEYLKTIRYVPKDAVTKITLTQQNQQLELIKQGSDWKLASKSADTAKVSELLDALYPSTSPVLTAQTPQQLKNLNASEDLAVKVTVSDSSKSTTLLVGKQIGSAAIVALSGKDQAYQISHVPVLELKPDNWYDTTVLDVDSQNIKQLTFTGGTVKYSLTQSENKVWNFEEETIKANSDGINTFITKFNPLKADNLAFEQKIKQYNLNLPDFSWVIKDTSEQETKLEFFKGTNDYLLKRTPEEFFVITTADAEGLRKLKDSFILPEKEQ